MSKNNRYLFLKRSFPKTVILLKEDNKLIKKLNAKHLNYIVINNLTIGRRKEFNDNNYDKEKIRNLLKKVIKKNINYVL